MPGSSPWLAAVLVLALAAVHLFASKLRFLDVVPRSRWLSMAGGASVSYVFLHLFPELALAQERLEGLDRNELGAGKEIALGVGNEIGFGVGKEIALDLGHEIYLLSLIGLAIFYGLERAAKVSRAESRRAGGEDVPEPGVFWLHIGSFALYNALVGYLLLHREDPTRRGLLLFFLAMALHFLVNDYGLRHHHKHLYDRLGRWLLATAVLLGWGIGLFREIGELYLALLFAFLAGGVVLNVLKEELPEERESHFGAFVAGAAGYAVIVLLA